MKTTTNLALSNIKNNRFRSILIGVAIFLTTVLLTAIGVSGAGVASANMKNVGLLYGEYHVAYQKVSEDMLGKMQPMAQFLKIGESTDIGSLKKNQNIFRYQYANQEMIQMMHLRVLEGTLPTTVDGIMAQQEFFQRQGYGQVKVGDTVSLSYRIQGEGKIIEKEFTITGLLASPKDPSTVKGFQAYVSRAFYETEIPVAEERSYTASVLLDNQNNLGEDEMTKKAEELGAQLGIEKKNVTMNKMYNMWALNPQVETVVFCISIMLVVIFFSVIVIYNIFHVSLIQKIQEYGKLKAIGITKKQLKSVIKKEGLLLSLPSIPLGLLVGLGISKIIMTIFEAGYQGQLEQWEKVNLFQPSILLLTAALALATVWISLRRPMKIVAKISAVEAMRYQEQGGKKAGLRKGRQEIKLSGLTKANLSGNKKRTVTTILTMGLSCVLFVTIANVLGSMDMESDARKAIEYGQFRLEIDGAIHDEAYPQRNLNNMQKEQPFNQEFLDKVKAIEGVTEVRTRKIVASYEKNPDLEESQKYNSIAVVSKEEFDWLVKEQHAGTVDYQKTVKEDGIIYMYGVFLEEEGYQFGDMLEFDILDGDRRVPYRGKLLGSCGHSNDANYTITEETFEKLDIQGDMTSVVFVDCEEKSKAAVQKELSGLLAGKEDFLLTSYDETLKSFKLAENMMVSAAYILFVVIGIIGFMNMANTMITSIITRRRELGILQAIGMTNRQLNIMLQTEGLIFTVGTLIIALSVGNVFGYAAFQYCKRRGFIGLNDYHFPWQEELIMIGAILLLQICLSFLLSRNLRKDSLIERIRYQG